MVMEEEEKIYNIEWSDGYKFSTLGHCINKKGKIMKPQKGSKAIIIYFSKKVIEELQPKHPFKAMSLRSLYMEFVPDKFKYEQYKLDVVYPSPWLFCTPEMDALVEKEWKEWTKIYGRQWTYSFQSYEVYIMGNLFKKYFFDKHPDLLQPAIEKELSEQEKIKNDKIRITEENKLNRRMLLSAARKGKQFKNLNKNL